MTIKIFEIGEFWMASEKEEDAVKELLGEGLIDEDRFEEETVKELSSEDLKKLKYHHDPDSEEGRVETFEERLNYLVSKNTQFPILFAMDLSSM